MKGYFIFILVIMLGLSGSSQILELPYREIPPLQEKYTSATVAAHLLDGLGFRYYWATEGLTSADLIFKPGEDARTSRETLEHIYGLTTTLLRSMNLEYQKGFKELSFEDLRAVTLFNIENASNLLKSEGANLELYEMSETIPFWYQINGPISDALWHVGQVVSFRRMSGNPFPAGVDLFRGKVGR